MAIGRILEQSDLSMKPILLLLLRYPFKCTREYIQTEIKFHVTVDNCRYELII